MHTRPWGCCTGLAPTWPNSPACWLRVPPYGVWVTFQLDPGHNLLPGLAQNGSTQPILMPPPLLKSPRCVPGSEIGDQRSRVAATAAAAAAAVPSRGLYGQYELVPRGTFLGLAWVFEVSRLCKLCKPYRWTWFFALDGNNERRCPWMMPGWRLARADG